MANGNENEKSYVETLKIPLIVGVTGHLDIITPEEEIKKQMECFWERLQKAAGPETEIILLSSIAQGADHLMVKYRPAGMRYCVVLPFDEKDYRKDFSGTALTEFEEDLKGAYKVIDCHAERGDYALASNYVRKHSDVLVTLWDGYENLNGETGKAERGGTYYQIREAFGLDDLLVQHQEKVHLIVNIPVERSRKGPDYHRERKEKKFTGFVSDGLSVIETDKEGKGKLIFTPFSEYDFGNDPVKPKPDIFVELLTSFCKLFTIKLEWEAKPETAFVDVLKYIRKHNESDLKPPKELKRKPYYLRTRMECYPDALRIVNADFNRHEYFDHDAGSHQTSYRRQFFWFVVITLIMGVLRISLKPHDDWIKNGVILLYLAGAVGVFWLWMKSDRQDHYTKYLVPRVIAELLRLKIFWSLVGIRESFNDHVFDESASYKFMVPICNWEIAETRLSEENWNWLEKENGFDAVKECWLKDQTDYYQRYLLPDSEHFIKPQPGEPCNGEICLSAAWFKKYFQTYDRRDGYVKGFKAICTVVGFISAFFLLVFFLMAKVCNLFPEFILSEFITPFQRCLAIAIPICFLGAAMSSWLMGKKKLDALSRQYRNAWKLFKKGRDFVCDDNQSVEDKRQLVKELVLFAYDENREWQTLRKNAKPEPMI